MESAIPPRLQTARSRHKRVPDDYQPPYPSFVARYKPTVNRVVMAYFGVQYRGAVPAAATDALAHLAKRFGAGDGPSHWDRADYIDQGGYSNVVSVAYWDDIARFDAWIKPAREDWTGKARDGIGTFIEVLRPTVARHETLFSSLGRPEGSALNALGGAVRRIAGVGNRVRVTVGSDPPVVAEVTDESVHRMSLAPGVRVVATWKATGTRLVPR